MKRIFFCVLLCFFLSSCGTIRGFIREDMAELAKSHKKNQDAMIETSVLLRETWEFDAGIYEAHKSDLKGEINDLIGQLDELYAGDWGDPVDARKAAQALDLRIQLWMKLGKQAIDDILPEILDIIRGL